jgi:hypothetical protein
VEVGQEIHHPCLLNAFICLLSLSTRGRQDSSAQNDHVQSSGRRIVDPLRRKRSDTVEAGQVDLLGIDHMIIRFLSKILDVLDEKRIRRMYLGEQNQLRTLLRESDSCLSTYPGRSARHHNYFSMEGLLGGIRATGCPDLEEEEECEDEGGVDYRAAMLADGFGNSILENAEKKNERHGDGLMAVLYQRML